MKQANKSGNFLWWLVSKIVLTVLAVVVIGPWEGAKRLYKKVYDEGWEDGIVFTLLAIVGSVYGGIHATGYLTHLGYHWLAWGGGLVGFLVSLGYACPIVWLILIHPIWRRAKDIWHAINDFAKENFESLAANILSAGRVLPGSDKVWNVVLDPKRKSWFMGLLKVVTYPSLVLGSGYLGWSIYTWAAALTTGWLGLAATVAGGIVAFLVFTSLSDLLCKFLHYGKAPALAELISLGVVGGAATYFAGLFGLSYLVTGLAALFALFLFSSYVFPLAVLLFSDHVLNWVLTTLKPLLEAAYEEKETPARHLVHQLTNFGVTILVGGAAAYLAVAITLPLWATAVAVAVTAALTYTLAGKALDWEGGSFIIGGALALASAIGTGLIYAHAGLIYGTYGAIVVGVITAVVMFGLVVPLLLAAYFRVSKWRFINTVVDFCGSGLSSLHGKVWTKFDALVDKCEKVYRYGYRDERPYDKLVLHVTNLGVTAAVALGLYFGVPSVSIGAQHPILQHVFGFFQAHHWVGIIGVLIATALTYLLAGRAIVKSGIELVGGLTAALFGVGAGYLVVAAQPLGMAFAVPFGIVFACFTYFLFFPGGFIVVRGITDHPAVVDTLLPFFAGAHERAWKAFEGTYNGVKAFFKPIVEFIAPYFQGFIGLLAGAWKSLMDAWHGMFGGRKS